MDYKTIISIIAVALTIIGYVPYVRDILKKKTKPHSFTWFISALAGFIAYGLQVFGGGGVGSWALLIASSICLIIFILSLRIGDKDIVFTDVVFLLFSLIALLLWLVVKQPVLSVILINAVEILGFVPTIRKSWNSPYSETLFTYELCIFRHALTFFALQQVNILTALTPIAWAVTNIIITAILIIRRRKIPKSDSTIKNLSATETLL